MSQLFKVIALAKCVVTILWIKLEPAARDKKTKLNIGRHMFTSSTQLQNRSFHVVERTRTSSKCQKMKNARAKRAKIMFFIVICKFVVFLLRSWLLKLPIIYFLGTAPTAKKFYNSTLRLLKCPNFVPKDFHVLLHRQSITALWKTARFFFSSRNYHIFNRT